MDAVVQILGVTVRNTKSGKTVYDVQCGDGKKRQVWEAGLANQINAYTGQQVSIRYDVKQNGQYVNESIQAFAPPGQQLPFDPSAQAAPMGEGGQMLAAPTALGTAQQAAPPIQAAPASGGSDRFPPEVTTRITKLACIDYASTLVGGIYAGSGPEALGEAVEAVRKVARTFYSDARAHEEATASGALQVTSQIVPTATTPQEVAQQLPAGMVQVGAPVAQQQDAAAEAPDTDTIDWN